MALEDHNNCDKKCENHGRVSTLVDQHELKINDIEGMSIEIGNDINNLEGRVNMFIWIIGIIFMLLCTIAFYGTIQINGFKDVYMRDTILQVKATAKLTTTVETSSNKVAELSEEMEEMREDHNRTLEKVSESELTGKMEKMLEAYDKLLKEK